MYTTTDLVLQGRHESNAESAVAVGIAIVSTGVEQHSSRVMTKVAATAEPRVRRPYEIHPITIPLGCIAITVTIISLIESLATTSSKGATIWVIKVIGIDIWRMSFSAKVITSVTYTRFV